jgi:hypothetical protein
MEAIWPPSSEIPNMSWVRHADKARYCAVEGGSRRMTAVYLIKNERYYLP